MVRVKRGLTKHKRHIKVKKATRGYEHARSKLHRAALNAFWKAGQYSFQGRRKKKGQMRKKWIMRLNGALESFSISYSKFIKKLSDRKIILNRKVLSEVAIRFPQAFKTVVEKALG